MSEFDKEAEREKLREQFEAEQEDREVTGRMSELLLQGATMTNKHCDTCGNPIFRYRGEEFCPVCQQQATQQAEQGQQPAQTGAQQAEQGQQAAQAGAQQAEQTAGEQAAPGHQSAAGQGGAPAQQAGTQQGGAPAQQPSTQPQQSGLQGQQPAAGQPSVPAPEGVGDLGEARASLVRTLTGLAGQAENTADVGRKRELLAAAREAAETLAALDRVNR